jgi:glutamate formiminotransferase
MNRIIECIPNISEGKDNSIINAIANEINAVKGVQLLHSDSNKSANRTVITFAGVPEQVVKAIGWYISESGCAQVSTNITNIDKTPLHALFKEVSEKAGKYGTKVTSSEMVGLVPLRALTKSGLFY